MSRKETPSERHDRITRALLESRLGYALELLGLATADVTDWQVTSELDDIRTAYNYMLQYFAGGVPDAGRIDLYRKLTARAFLLNDTVSIHARAESSMLLADQARRQRTNRPADYSGWQTSLERFSSMIQMAESDSNSDSAQLTRLLTDHEILLSDIFTHIWTSLIWDAGTSACISRILDDMEIGINDKLLITSAVTMSLMEHFDPQKMILLGNYCNAADTRLSVRALTGFTLIGAKYDKILPYFPEIISQIRILADSVDIQTRIQSIQIALFLSRETDSIDRKMRDEIIPTMLHSTSGFNKGNSDNLPEDINPEWDRMMEDSDIQKRLREMTELQMEGADIYMSTFSNLKNYPFFREVSGWFRPFDFNQPDVRKALSELGIKSDGFIASGILKSGIFCNSDKYSFCLTLQQIPESQRHQIADQIAEQTEGMEELMSHETVKPSVLYDQNARQYIQDLYRFFKLFPRRHEFWNPFENSTNLFNIRFLSPMTDIPQFERTAAEILLKKGYYDEAAELFQKLISHNGPESADWQVWQKYGFSLQKGQRYGEAVDAYQKADILEPDNLWTLRHIASCYRESGNLDEAIRYLLVAERTAPDDMQLLLSTGETLTAAGRYDEAMSRLFKVGYNRPESIAVKRDIAWCAFLSSQYDQSRKYWTAVLESTTDNPSATDLMNSGHLEWASGNTPLAVSLYRKAISVAGTEEFSKMLDGDTATLSSKGISDIDIILMKDLLASGK